MSEGMNGCQFMSIPKKFPDAASQLCSESEMLWFALRLTQFGVNRVAWREIAAGSNRLA